MLAVYHLKEEVYFRVSLTSPVLFVNTFAGIVVLPCGDCTSVVDAY
jgi:hypothetical protein